VQDYIQFRKMITPIIIQVVFWIVVALCLIGGLIQLTQSPLAGIALILFGPVVARIYAELLIVLFEINNALQDIRGRGRGLTGTTSTPAD